MWPFGKKKNPTCIIVNDSGVYGAQKELEEALKANREAYLERAILRNDSQFEDWWNVYKQDCYYVPWELKDVYKLTEIKPMIWGDIELQSPYHKRESLFDNTRTMIVEDLYAGR